MSMSRTAATFAPPVMEARRWIDGISFPADRPLINVSQAAPVEPPPAPLRQAIADAALTDDEAHLYGPVLGLPALRSELATHWSEDYAGTIPSEAVGITSGCNQAFAAAIHALTGEGDEVLLPTPWYFNHKMWLDMAGVRAVPVPTGNDLLPDPDRVAGLITDRTRAIVLVTPNNPGGVEYPRDLIDAMMDLASSRDLKLIVDETYRDFHAQNGPPHRLFQRADWEHTLIHLYSFSKAYRLTGHRVGAVVAARETLAEIEKFLDTVAICPGQIGQRAALWGMRNLRQWLAGERDEILDRRAAMADGFARLAPQGWRLLGVGAYFAYAEHPFDIPSDDLARRLVTEAGILLLPGTMFQPDGSEAGKQQVRLAFANLDRAGIGVLIDRLAALAF
ncbi:MAG: aminotransferase [Pseudomonadota bacterium]